METKDTEMGKVRVEIEVINSTDDDIVQKGLIPANQVRRATLSALVDTGATILVLPQDVIERLGLPVLRRVRTRIASGEILACNVYGSAKLKVQGRIVGTDVLGGPPGVPALLGQVPLELLDFVVDSKNGRLLPNPESPDPEMALVDIL